MMLRFIKRMILLLICIGLIMFQSTPMVEANLNKLNMAYIYFGNSNTYKGSIDKTKDSIQVISPSYFNINEDGSLGVPSNIDISFIRDMRKRNIKVIPFLSNHWNRELGRLALEKREALVDELVRAVRQYELDGVNVDIENVTEVDRDAFTDLVKKLRERLPAEKVVSVAVAANPYGFSKGWHGSYDYAALGKYSDYMIFMTYDEGHQGGPPAPVASSSFVEKSILHALESVPKEKIVLGIPFYGRYWKDGEDYGGYGINLNSIDQLMVKYRGRVSYDGLKQSPKAVITIGELDQKPRYNGKELTPGTYTIWYENEASIKHKLRLVQKYNLKGTASWSLGQEMEGTWDYFSLWLNGRYFLDITNHWARIPILDMEARGWMAGTSSTLFSPDVPLNRAQAAVTLVKAMGLENKEAKASFFKDVTHSHWAKKEIDIIMEQGIMIGDEKGNFHPDSPVTREQMAAILDRMLPQLKSKSSNAIGFKDVKSNSWSYFAIMKAAENDLFMGYPDGTFRPRENINRAQMAALLSRIILKGHIVRIK